MPEAQSAHHPPQEQDRQPGLRSEMVPKPRSEMRDYRGAGKLEGKAALVTGGDSGIGRAVAIGFAKEGADVAIVYLDEHEDAESTRALVEEQGRRCIAIAGDIGDEAFCQRRRGASGRGVRPARPPGQQRRRAAPAGPPRGHQRRAAGAHLPHQHLRHVPPDQGGARPPATGAAIINTASVTAYRGSPHLIDYAATKGAIVAFTRSLAENLKERRIRVNAVAPGPVWTPLIPASFPADHVAQLRREDLPRPPGRAGRDRAELYLPRLGRRHLHDRPGAPPQRRRDRWRLTRLRALAHQGRAAR